MRSRSAFLAPLLAYALAVGCETRPDLDLSSTVLDYGVFDNTLALRIKNTGKQQLHWSAVSETGWINSIEPALGTLDEDAEESILVTINRAGLPVGLHSGSLRIIANGEHPEEIIEVLCMIETEDELVFAPGTPSGPATLCTDAAGNYQVADALSSWGHALEYQFDWGGGELSPWGAAQGTHLFGEGSFCVKARARCATDTGVVSDWSGCAQVEVADESVLAPDIPTGPTNGATQQVLAYATSGAASTCGHPISVQFDWGDGTASVWGSGSDSHAWDKGFYCVKTRARCETHPSIVSEWTECLNVSIATGESVSAPAAPSGSSSLCVGVAANYATGGAVSSMDHPVEYQFDWDDGGLSAWGATSLSHSWSEGSYCVRSRARCTLHTDVISAWSICNTVVVSEEEIVPPLTPTGPLTGNSSEVLSYSASGAASTCGHPVQYQFDWGDDNLSSWGAATRTHSWTTGSYCVQARARCQTHTTFVSDFSPCLNITIGTAETVSTPSEPAGATSLCIGVAASYTTGSAESNLSHAVEYQFDWGDGTQSSWGAATVSHDWDAGPYCVKARARCAAHTNIVSNWSVCHAVNVAAETVATPAIPIGPTSGSEDDTLSYTTSGGASSCGHAVEYEFDWGDGTTSGWGAATRTHTWDSGPYCVKARTRCVTHPTIVSAYSGCLNIVIGSGETVSAPTTPTGPSILCIDAAGNYSTGGSTSSVGHAVEYQFDWGDGTQSNWGVTARSHSWSAGLDYCVKARARCVTHTGIISAWSLCNLVDAVAETVSPPSIPSGPTSGSTDDTLTYTTGNSGSSCGHSLQYRFDWDDGEISSWGSTTRSHGWEDPGGYCVKAQARCATHTTIESGWSECLNIVIGDGETVDAPTAPAGPTSLCIGVTGNYSTTGGASSMGHIVQYQFDWGDGTQSTWGASFSSHSWSSAGNKCVKVRARCLTHTAIVSAWSICTTVAVGSETVSAPSTPSGPTSGEPDDLLSYATSGASSSCGHPVQYQFDWGDGDFSGWGASSGQHTFSAGSFCVRARARCILDNQILSAWSSCLTVNIASPENVSPPNTPAGPSSLCVGASADYTTGGSGSNLGHTLEYQFEWDDGTQSSWGATTRSHAWSSAGVNCVRARARCATHTTIESNWSACRDVTVSSETVSAPSTPSGPTSGDPGDLLAYTTGGAGSSCGHPVEYQFDWGDGNQSGWGAASGQHTFSAGSYCVKARARCSAHTTIVSAYSSCLTVNIAAPENVSPPNVPIGPSSLCVGVSGDYTTGGSGSNLGHTLEYQFEWDDGTLSQWGTTMRSHAWNSTGDFCVRARARCATHTTIESNWSTCKDVTVSSETVAAPSTPSGPTSGDPGDLLAYTTGGAASSCGHPVEYQFDWGDGDQSGWGAASGQHTFSAGSYCVKARARCSAHTTIVSAYSSCLMVNIAAPENVSPPNVPAGSSSLCVGESADYTTGGSGSNLGHTVEYQFEWDDGTQSLWGATTRSHAWNSAGDFCVRARARCATHTTIESNWSTCNSVGVEAETVSIPSSPSGPTQGEPQEVLSYSSGGASSTCGHSVQIQFDWGDGTQSSWGDGSDSHSWPEGAYCVQARARCATHTSIQSDWSGCTNVTIAEPQENVSAPNAPSGPTTLCEDVSGDYSTSGAGSNLGHTLEYQYDWGDGTQSSWGAASNSHSFGSGVVCVQVRARCETHTQVVSAWSNCTTVTVDAHVVSAPSVTGPTEGMIEVSYCYEATGAVCSCGDGIDHYEFDWGPGSTSSPCHTWDEAGTYCVRARGVCAGDHTSPWSECLTVDIQRSVFLELNCAPGCESLLFVSNFYESISLVSNCPGTSCASPTWNDCSGCGIGIQGRLLTDCDFYPSSSGNEGLEISPSATSIELAYRATAEPDLLFGVAMQICLDDNCTQQQISTSCERYSPSFSPTQSAPPVKIRVGIRGGLNELDLIVGESTSGTVIRYDFPGWLVADNGSFAGTVAPLLASVPRSLQSGKSSH